MYIYISVGIFVVVTKITMYVHRNGVHWAFPHNKPLWLWRTLYTEGVYSILCMTKIKKFQIPAHLVNSHTDKQKYDSAYASV